MAYKVEGQCDDTQPRRQSSGSGETQGVGKVAMNPYHLNQLKLIVSLGP